MAAIANNNGAAPQQYNTTTRRYDCIGLASRTSQPTTNPIMTWVIVSGSVSGPFAAEIAATTSVSTTPPNCSPIRRVTISTSNPN